MLGLIEVLRPRIPLWLIKPVVRWRIRRALVKPHIIAVGVEQMEFLLGETDRAARIPEAGRGFVEHRMWCNELRWHPNAITRQRVEGFEHLRAAHALGRGVILNFMHHGQYDGAFGSLAQLGVHIHVVAGTTMLLPTAPGMIKQHLRVVAKGGELLSAGIGTAGLVNGLKNGQIIAVASDVPGGSQLEFAGRQVMGSSGAARAATMANSPIVLLTSHTGPDGVYIRLVRAIEPTDFNSVDELLEAMIRHHEAAVLDWPEASDIPMACWGTPPAVE